MREKKRISWPLRFRPTYHPRPLESPQNLQAAQNHPNPSLCRNFPHLKLSIRTCHTCLLKCWSCFPVWDPLSVGDTYHWSRDLLTVVFLSQTPKSLTPGSSFPRKDVAKSLCVSPSIVSATYSSLLPCLSRWDSSMVHWIATTGDFFCGKNMFTTDFFCGFCHVRKEYPENKIKSTDRFNPGPRAIISR